MPLPVKPPRGGASSTALHDNVAGEISALPNKATPVGGDFLLIEDSAAGDVKSYILISQLEAVIDHGSIAGLGDVADHLLYLDLAGTRAMTGGLDMGEFDITNAGDVNLDSVTPDAADISFFKADGSTVSLLWDESDDRWEFSTNVRITGGAIPLSILGADASSAIYMYHDGVNLSAIIGHTVVADDEFYFRSLRGRLILRAEDNENNAGADIVLQSDNSSGAVKNRWLLDGSTGDYLFFKDDGSTISLLWDESDDRWEFATDVEVSASTTPGGILRLTNADTSIGAAEELGSLEFYSSDASTNGAGVRGFVKAVENDSGFGRSYDLVFGTGSAAAAIEQMRIDKAGKVGIGLTVPTAQLHVDQSSTFAAVPVLTLDQADVDEDYFKFVGTSDTSVDRALVDAANFTTPGAIVGWVKVNVQDDQGTAPITDGDYYIPFYAAPTA